ncbi:MAG: Ig-like domain-containing protein [Anaerovorax sp.]
MKQTKRFKRFAMAMTIVAMLAMSVMPSFATTPTGLNLIGASPSQMMNIASLENPSRYGIDTMAPIVLQFNQAVPAGVGASDFILTAVGGTTKIVPVVVAVSGSKITLAPDQSEYLPDAICTLDFKGELNAIADITFKTKAIGGGDGTTIGSKAPLYCVGKIVDSALIGSGTVPTDLKDFMFTFTNAVYSKKDDSVNKGNIAAVKFVKWNGTGTPAADITDAGWQSVSDASVTLGQNDTKQNLYIQKAANLEAAAVYRIYIGSGLQANGGNHLAEVVDVQFTTDAQ